MLSNDERIHWLRQERWIQYPRAERILERLLDLVDYPPRDRMPCLAMYGGTQLGGVVAVHEVVYYARGCRGLENSHLRGC